jgi:hypothetical protein
VIPSEDEAENLGLFFSGGSPTATPCHLELAHFRNVFPVPRGEGFGPGLPSMPGPAEVERASLVFFARGRL